MQLRMKCLEWSNLNRRAQNVKSAKNNGQPKPAESLYCLELSGNLDNNHLACLGSNQIVTIYDQTNLKLISQLKLTSETNSIGYFKKSNHMLFSCANQGILKCWDARENKSSSIEFEPIVSPVRDLLCADVNSSDQLIAVGTSKTVEDALILIYDLRSTQRPLHKLRESHSSDISQVKFNPNCPSKFSSAGMDGLVGFYDLDLKSESPAG